MTVTLPPPSLPSLLILILTLQVSDLIQGIQLGMVSGENAVSHVTANLEFSVSSNLISSTGDTQFTASYLERSSGIRYLQPKITLGPLGLSACKYGNGYAYMSVLKWSNNPYGGSTSVKSPLLRVSSETDAESEDTSEQYSLSVGVKGNRVTYTHNASQIPVYTITLPFSHEQSFNFSAMNSSFSFPGQSRTNFTLPLCIQHIGLAYVPCNHCNISSFTNENVTYNCYDVSQLCTSWSPKRRLQDGERDTYSMVDRVVDSDRHRVLDRAGDRDRRHARSLSGSDSGTTAMVTQASTYGTLVQSVISELSDVLSNNPFTLDITKCKVVLGFTLGLSTFIILMLAYLLRLDYYETLDKKYVMKERFAEVRRQMIDDLKSGGKGDLGVTYQEYSQKSKESRRANGSIMSSIIIPGKRNNFIGGQGDNSPGRVNSSFVSSESPMHYDKHVTLPPSSLHVDGSSSSSSSSSVSSGSCMVECKTITNHDPDETYTTRAVITEYMHKLFPGHSIFSGKRNLMKIIFLNHDYFRMFAGSDLRKSRTIRFLSLLSIVLPFIFTDTVFFGIYFPSNSVCAANINKVGFALYDVS
jgi:hypothetical protein